MEYVPEQKVYKMPEPETTICATQERKQKSDRKVFTLREMLLLMQCPLVDEEDINSEAFDNEENFWYNFDWDMIQAEKCSIPESFRHNRTNMENALKLLIGWNELEDSQFKTFTGRTISYLAEVLETGECCGKAVNYHNLISYLNYINWGGKDEYEQMHTEESLYDFMNSFFKHYCRQIVLYPPTSSNTKGYLTRMLINYLNGEYQAGATHVSACIENLNHPQYHYGKKTLTQEEIDRMDEYNQFVNQFPDTKMSPDEVHEMNEYLDYRFEYEDDITFPVPEMANEELPTINSIEESPQDILPIPNVSELKDFYEFENYGFEEYIGTNSFFVAVHYINDRGKIAIHHQVLSDASSFMNETDFDSYSQRIAEKTKKKSPEFLECIGFDTKSPLHTGQNQ